MATELDLKAVSVFSTVSEAALSSLLSAPTPETVTSFLQNVQKNAKECEQNKSQRVRLEVELETVVRTNESKVKVLQNSRDKALSDVQKIRGDLQQSETNRSQVQSELERLRSTTSSDASETTTLKSRISSLEASNRDTLALLESKTNAYDKLSQDLSAQHQKSTELRKQVASLEQASQSSTSAAANARFMEQTLQQEIDLLKKNNDWLENERKVKADEHTAFRKDKNARIAELSRSNEQYIANAEALKRSEVSLKHRLDDYVNKFEDSQQELQRLRDEKSTDAESFRGDLENVQRLADLQKAQADGAKQRIQDLQEEVEEIKEKAAEELGIIRSEAEQDFQEKEAAVRKITELEATIAQLRSEAEEQRQRPETPQPPNGHMPATPGRPSTPLGIFTPSSKARNPTSTQMYSEYKRVERELAKERLEKDNLQKELDEIVAQLEELSPNSTNKARDEASRSARVYQSQLEGRTKEAEALQQQLRDLSSQCRRLLMELEIRERGQTLTDEDWMRLQAEADERNQAELKGLSETQQVEREEQFVSMKSELETARAQIAGFQDEIKTMVAQSKSFVKERDMFRNMLTRKGHLGDGMDFSRSLPVPAAGSPNKALSASVSQADSSDFSKLIKEMQQQLDAQKEVSNMDHASLRSQLDNLSKRNSELQTATSRLQGQLSAATQRAEMLQTNYNMLKTENGELQRRSASSMETATKQEMRIQQAAEDLIETKGLAESLQRESANLKAEKDLWKSVEKRLIEDNETLRNERGRLDQLNSSLQSILNEREQTDSETRRRLQSQSESLETELQATKRKLNDEQEENRKASQRREYEYEQSQKRIDDLMTSLGAVREELASVKTSRDHLQARVDELNVEIRAAEERLEVYTKPADATENTEEDTISKEQELTLEISQLKRELEHTKADLERANEQIDVYKHISQSAEERLAELGETNDQYREETDASIAEKDSKIKDLEQRIEDVSSELENTNTELSKLRDQQTDVDRRLSEQKNSFESEIERLKESEERATEQAQFNLEASKAQAQIATEAQQNYENELVKHADAARNLQVARTEANQLRLDAVDLRTKADTAVHDLQQKESSWTEVKDRYEQELADLKKRREEVLQQNSLLHNQLEGLTQQISVLQKDRLALSESSEANPSSSADLDNLQEVIKYLRREKEIVDVQYHLSQQEAKRVRQQLDFTQSQLDETRLKLDQQRRSEADSERNAVSHNKLMETLNELNLFRESSVTLRAEAKQASQALASKTQQVEELEARIEPLQAQVTELEGLLETRDGELKLLQSDRDHWRQRTQDILSKYHRIDPAELEALKEQLTKLEKERDEAIQARDGLQSQVDTIPDQIKEAKDVQRNALGEQFKTKLREANGKLKDKQTELDAATGEKDTIQQELNDVREQLETSRTRQTSSNQVNGDTAEVNGASEEINERVVELESRISELEQSLEQKDGQIASLTAEKDTAVKAKEEFVKEHFRKKFEDAKSEAAKTKDAALQELRTRLEDDHKKAMDQLRNELSNNTAAPTNPTPTSAPAEEGEVSASSEALAISDEAFLAQTPERWSWAIKNVDRLKSILAANVRARVEKAVEATKAELQAAQIPNGEGATVTDAQLAQIRSEMETALNKQQTDFVTEKATLEQQYQERFEKEKADLVAEHQQELQSKRLEFDQAAAAKIADQVQKAEQMAEKKHALKLNMTTNRANAALAKLKVVETASTDTPERAVKEVWEEAKNAKAVPVAAAAKPAASNGAAPVEEPNAEKDGTVPDTQNTQPSVAATATPANSVPVVPNGPTRPAVATTTATRGVSSLPRGAASSLPRGRGGPATVNTASRGGGIPRGGRGGIPRAGSRSASIGGPGQRGGSVAGSPTRGGLNPGAIQFVPGGKRAREESDTGAEGGQKRPRGGGQAS
ncbi:Nucleoprotein TPR [Cyphellophora attinorum]|uniref:Nucleoprotein TPR n=1 Tax=Cyphellophora attinorum TaxID=1664694 RepID=A0A0N1HA03_9EURO|nr:Nucleoprotein TPR [Phialophora attinorum]KPI40663.1 Nucleoprotein TPR [Phialophora attinorum]